MGAQILSTINFQVPVIPYVKHHHENWDGSGYPDGLKGEEIPFGSRIMAVADCYEALTARRVYRRSLDRETAISIMKQEAHRFDSRVFNKFLEIVDELDEQLRTLAVRELPAPKEHRDKKRMPDIVGGSSGSCVHRLDIRAPTRGIHAVRDPTDYRQFFVPSRHAHYHCIQDRKDHPV